MFASPNHHALCGCTPTSNCMGDPSPRLIKVEGVVVLIGVAMLVVGRWQGLHISLEKGRELERGSWWIGLREEEQEERDREP